MNPHDLSPAEYSQWLRQQVGKKYRGKWTLMNGESGEYHGEVREVPYQGSTRVTLVVTGGNRTFDDPMWYFERRLHPWEEVAPEAACG